MIGCFASIIYWKLERCEFVKIYDNYLRKVVGRNHIIEALHIIMTGLIVYIFGVLPGYEVINALTAFIVIDVSSTERKNLFISESTLFYDSISNISKSLVGGFTAPLVYILVLGNGFGIAYMLLFNLSMANDYPLIRRLYYTASIVPALLVEVIMYGIYFIRRRKIYIDFKGDYFKNCFFRPLVNIDILGAHIESVSFYYYFNDKEGHYVKGYGEYAKKVDMSCIKDYLSIAYGTAMIYFVVFFILFREVSIV
ncbi:MAG: hypothetical protein Q8930_12815 [Bacillota bacterium]|nr:hypothetical protein [Bacillota bacterium]